MATYFANCNTLNLDLSVNRGVSESCVSESWRTGPSSRIQNLILILLFLENTVISKIELSLI